MEENGVPFTVNIDCFLDGLRGNVKETTLKGYEVALESFKRFLKDNGISEPQEEAIRSYALFLNNSESISSSGTRNRYMRVVKQLFTWTAKKGFYPNVAEEVRKAKVTADNTKREAFSEEDMQRIITAVDRTGEKGARNYALLLLAVTGGLRVCEIHRADIGDLQTIRGQRVLYIQGKGRDEKDASVKLIPEVEDALTEYLSYRKDTGKKDPLFTGAGNRSRERLSLTSISAIFKDLFRKAGYDSSKLTAHSLRHTSNTLLFKAGADLYTVQQHARHSDPKTTEIYLHMAEREEDRSEQQIYTQIFSAERNRIISQLTATLSELTTEELAEALRYVEGLRQDKNLSLLAK